MNLPTVELETIYFIYNSICNYMCPSLHKPPIHRIFSNYFLCASAIYVDCSGIFLIIFIRVTIQKLRAPERDRSELLDFKKSEIKKTHSHHVYNSDGILDRSWRNYTDLTLHTAAQGSQHMVGYTYDVN